MHPLHPMMVHFPIALLSSSVFFDLLAAQWHREEFRATSWWTLALGLGGALASVGTGAMAEEAAEGSGVPKHVLELHEHLGFATFWIFAVLSALHAGEKLNLIAEWPRLRIALGLGGLAVLYIASYYGGSLVYDYGAGVALNR